VNADALRRACEMSSWVISSGHRLLHVSADDMLARGEQVQLFDQVETLEFEMEVVVLLAFELEVIGFAFAVRSVLNGGFEWSGVGLDRAFAVEQVENPIDGVELFLPLVVDPELGSAPGAFAIPAKDDSAAYSEGVVGFEIAVLWEMALRRVLELDPNCHEVRNNLAVLRRLRPELLTA
jgi:hypothetical protein